MDSDYELSSPDGLESDIDDLDDLEITKDGDSKRTRSGGVVGPISDLKGVSGYSWEDEYHRSWDVFKDEASGRRSLESIIQGMIESRKKRIMKNPSTPFQRGIIRTLILIIDGSLAMLEKDLKPTRFSATLSMVQEFIVEFFDQNPISQLGILVMRNGISNLVSEVNGLPQYHIDKIRQLKSRMHNKYEPKGDPSLQNSLEMARSMLKHNFGNCSKDSKNSKEVLIIFGALFSSDPNDIHETINNLVKDEIKVKVIGLSAQVAICQEMVIKTNHEQRSISSKNYGVIMGESHFKELLIECVIPLPISAQEKAADVKNEKGVPLIKMGFPSKTQNLPASTITFDKSVYEIDFPKLSSSHPTEGLDSAQSAVAGGVGFTNSVGYQCPQCLSKVFNLPTVCPVCGLMLILSTHLAPSYHHLVPLPPFEGVQVATEYKSLNCYACLLKFPKGTVSQQTEQPFLDLLSSSRYQCIKCLAHFCIDCDVFIHEILHNCPSCENTVAESSA